MMLFSTPSISPWPITTAMRSQFGAEKNTTAQTSSSGTATTA